MKEGIGLKKIGDVYGENVFNLKTMQKYLSNKAYKALSSTIKEGRSLTSEIADEVADAMKIWAVSKGATHFTHWFQPLTGTTAEKHDSFIVPDKEGGVVLKFSGKELIKGEPDASSFPSGGLRATFEARGYTAWDPTSPAFIKEGTKGATLCIPTAFYSYHGEALDKKTPLLRSIHALSKQTTRLAKLFNIPTDTDRAYVTLGVEQEYFLVNKKFYKKRLDLIQTGRTLFGRKPAKHQQMGDHYFGAIKARVLAFMEDVDWALWKLGIPSKTRHNEVCPAQFEVAPIFEEQNISIDHNMMVMETLKQIAERHGFVCLLHEKPFAGVNGSGKHNNWSICGPDGKNWLSPGDNPHDNAIFLTMISALIKAIDEHADLLRVSVASSGNDQRLGGNEAPPAILSVFLGEQLTDVIEQIEKGGAKSSKKASMIKIGETALPPLSRDTTDRNRTSPFAFTGNKFEFRAVGSDQNCASANIIFNVILAEALDDICTKLEAKSAEGTKFNACLQKIMRDIVKKHKRVLFNGDNYSTAWAKEAARRRLPNLKTTPRALKVLKDKKNIDLFEKHKVLSKAELISRYEAYSQQYEKIVKIEANTALTIAKTMIIPAAINYAGVVGRVVNDIYGPGMNLKNTKALLKQVVQHVEKTLVLTEALERCVDENKTEKIITCMEHLRESIDTLEGLLPESMWPLPTYAKMMSLS